MKITPDNIGRQFIELTKYKYQQTPSPMVAGQPMPNPVWRHPEAGEVFPLPPPDFTRLDAHSFSEVLNGRRSRRNYSNESLTLDELSLLLFATAGIQRFTAGFTLRPPPSAGARHPLETFLGINRVAGLDSGLYHYLPFDHALAQVRRDELIGRRIADACLKQTIFEISAVNFIWTSVFYRSSWKYGQRGIRYIHLDAGHVAQNLYLAGEALGLGCCAVGAFDDDECNLLLGIDGIEHFCIYLATIGRTRA